MDQKPTSPSPLFPAVEDIIQKIHDHPAQAVVVVTGAGTRALSWLFGVAGASRTMLEARVPYAATAFQEFIGQEPEKYVSTTSARLLAGHALRRAFSLVGMWPPRGEGRFAPLIGLACTATISTDYVKRGDHHGYVAVWTPGRIVTCGILFEKGERERTEEEEIISRMVVNGLAEICDIEEQLPLDLTLEDRFEREVFDLAAVVDGLLGENITYAGLYADGRLRTDGIDPEVLLPGSFNPLHEGHLGLARAAAEILERPVAFEMSLFNVDKPPLPRQETLHRLVQFAGDYPVYLTHAPTFIEKARLFPRTTFVVGFDTARRILAPRYYDESPTAMRAALSEIDDLGCRFLVAGRSGDDGVFHTVAELDVPDRFRRLFAPIPPERFRRDISSTEIRARMAAPAD